MNKIIKTLSICIVCFFVFSPISINFAEEVTASEVNVSGDDSAEAPVSENPIIEIRNPKSNQVWLGVEKIDIDVKNIDLSNVRTLSVFLDGRLIKEFNTPPYSFKYNFGQSPKYSKLEVLATTRSETGRNQFRQFVRSYEADDFQTVNVMQVVVPLVVTDRRGNYIPGLKKEDFTILEDGQEQNVSYFSTSGKSRFHLALLIDISSSMKDKIAEVKQVARTFLKQLMRKEDKAIILFFNHDVFEDSEFTNDISELDSSLSVAMPFGATALYDAVAYTAKMFKSIIGQNIIILFSDGEDNSSTIDPYTLMKIVERSNSMIYSIGRGMDVYTQYQDLLKKISTSSGGMTFFFDDVKDLEKLYNKIRNDIRAKYVLQFAPKNSTKQNRFRKIKVVLSKKGIEKFGKRKVKIRTMKGYFY
jgi:VWFA-related protein